MRIARVRAGEAIGFGIIEGEEVVLLDGPPIGEIRRSKQTLRMNECKLLAPVLPSKIVAVGRNYVEHAAELGNEVPSEPLLFLKPSTAVIGPGDTIRKPAGVERLDHEAELAVVVKGLVRNADLETAEASILGYTCGNDVSARDYQKSDGQWTRAKGFDTFCPLGPWIETDLDVSAVRVEARVNGEVRQSGSTKEMVFAPAFLVAYISQIMTLLPGDVIMTGTPAGVGPLEAGDTVEIEVEGIGVLANGVEARP